MTMSVCRAAMLAAALAMAVLVGPRGAMAQAAPPRPRATDADTAIDAYVNYQIAQLLSDDVAAQQKARDLVIAAATPDKADSIYFGTFDTVLNNRLSALVSDTKSSIRAKICAGRICQRVATLTKDAAENLQQSDQQLLADSAAAVQAYGLKAAGPIVTAMLNDVRNPPINALAGAIVKAANKDTPASMVDDAWHALTPDVPAAAKARMVPFVQQFIEERRDYYINGAPSNPMSDSFGVLLLCSTWGQQSSSDRTHSMQDISDLIAVSGQRANTSIVTTDLAKYAQMYDNIFKAFDQNSSAIPTAMPIVAPLKDMEMTANKTTIRDATTQVCAGLCKGTADWGPLQPPPPIVAVKP
jgi:hypothetical protein